MSRRQPSRSPVSSSQSRRARPRHLPSSPARSRACSPTATSAPDIPYTPAEIADEAKRAYDAGASVGPHPRPQRRRVADLLAGRCSPRSSHRDAEGSLPDPAELLDGHPPRRRERSVRPTIREIKPRHRRPQHGHHELFEVLARSGRQFDFDMIFPEQVREDHQALLIGHERVRREARARVLRHADTPTASGRSLDMGVLKRRRSSSRSSSTCWAVSPGASSRCSCRRSLMPPGSEWEVIGISHGHWRMMAAALVAGRQRAHRAWKITSTCRAARWLPPTGRSSRWR